MLYLFSVLFKYSLYFKLNLFLIGGLLFYNSVDILPYSQHESTIDINVFSPSDHPTHLTDDWIKKLWCMHAIGDISRKRNTFDSALMHGG